MKGLGIGGCLLRYVRLGKVMCKRGRFEDEGWWKVKSGKLES